MSPASFSKQSKKLYMMAHSDFLMIGGVKGHSRAAIKLDKDLTSGTCDATETFNNPVLSKYVLVG